MSPQLRPIHVGMHLVAVHRGAIAESHRLKPEISHFGVGGRPIDDEIEFELLLESRKRLSLPAANPQQSMPKVYRSCQQGG